MFFDLDDDRPDTPRVPPSLPEFVVALSSLGLHTLFALALVLVPAVWPAAEPEAVAFVSRDHEPVRFVEVLPLVDRLAPPRLDAPHSDLDRRAETLERPPDARDMTPYSRGNTPENVLGAPEMRAEGPDRPDPRRAEPTPEAAAPGTGETIPLRELVKPAPPAGGSLGRSLLDFRSLLEDQNFDSPQGGMLDEGAEIQFDSKGVDFGYWLRRFRAQVRSNWYVPQSAMLFSGRVVLQFYVDRAGRITELRVVAPSDVDAFNASSFNALKLSNPTLPLPEAYPLNRALFTVTFFYNEDPRDQRRSR
jgi:TonB family protein